MQKPPVHRLVIFQGCVLGLIALAMLPFGRVAFYSAVLGMLLVILPQAYFAWRVFRYQGAKFSQSILKSFYVGEASKLFMTFAGFAVIFSCIHPLNAGLLMSVFIIGQLLFWFAPLLLTSSRALTPHKTTRVQPEKSMVVR